MHRKTFVVITFLLALAGVESQAGENPTLTVRVEGIQQGKKGEVGVAVFSSRKGYPIHIEHSYETSWIPVEGGKDALDFTFDSLPAGEYAVSVLHDENGNRALERSTLGFPKEGVGFSNDQKVKLSAPKFEKCKFPLQPGENKKMAVTLEYRDK